MPSPTAFTTRKQPADRTFTAALAVLGLLAGVQLFAALAALIPSIDFDKLAARPREQAAPAPAAGPSEATVRQANALLAEAEQFGREGNLQGVLEALTEAERLIPNEPGVLFQIALTHRQMGDIPAALEGAKRVLSLPAAQSNPAYAAIRENAQSLLAQLEGGAAAPPAAEEAQAAGKGASMMRDDFGIPMGAVMGIVDCRLVNGEPGVKELRIATKASTSVKIDPGALKVVVYFYEQTDNGEILQTSSKIMSEWMTPPTEWTGGEPELLTVKYPLPPAERGDLPPLQYHGYVVGIYYEGEMQDWRADPVALLDQFPLKLSITGEGQ
jgi:hypothetical protein